MRLDVSRARTTIIKKATLNLVSPSVMMGGGVLIILIQTCIFFANIYINVMEEYLYIYCVYNPSLHVSGFEYCVKIGVTRDLKRRLRELSGTYVPTAYRIVDVIVCPLEFRHIERDLHKLYSKHRIDEKKEFFNVSRNDIIQQFQNIRDQYDFPHPMEVD